LKPERGEACTRGAAVAVDAWDDLDFMISWTRWYTVRQPEKSLWWAIRLPSNGNRKIKGGHTLENEEKDKDY